MDRTFPILKKTAWAIAVLVAFWAFDAPVAAQPIYEQYEQDNPIPDESTFRRSGSGGSFDGLKPGLGREDTYYAFSGCFKIAWIKQQKLRRTEWEMAVDKMVLDCNMLPLGDDERSIIINYLVANYGRGT